MLGALLLVAGLPVHGPRRRRRGDDIAVRRVDDDASPRQPRASLDPRRSAEGADRSVQQKRSERLREGRRRRPLAGSDGARGARRPRRQVTEVDLAVIGGGRAGYAARSGRVIGVSASSSSKTVTSAASASNRGCIPTKVLLHVVEISAAVPRWERRACSPMSRAWCTDSCARRGGGEAGGAECTRCCGTRASRSSPAAVASAREAWSWATAQSTRATCSSPRAPRRLGRDCPASTSRESWTPTGCSRSVRCPSGCSSSARGLSAASGPPC